MKEILARPVLLVMVSECGRNDIPGFEARSQKRKRMEIALADEGNAGIKEHC